jgi:hypothetical protein
VTFADKVLALCLIFDCSETSGFRTEKRNELVGGAPNSRHLVGLGRDIVPDDPSRTDDVCQAARRLGLWVLVEGDHIHLQEPRI